MFSSRLTKLLKERDVSQAQVAAATGASQPTVSRWLSGAARPDYNEFHKIAVLLGMSMEEVLGADEIQRRASVATSVVMEAMARDVVPTLDESIAAFEKEIARLDGLAERFSGHAESLRRNLDTMRADRQSLAPHARPVSYKKIARAERAQQQQQQNPPNP